MKLRNSNLTPTFFRQRKKARALPSLPARQRAAAEGASMTEPQ
jgi:hypothetical protein